MESAPGSLPGSANFLPGASNVTFHGPVTATANIHQEIRQENFDPLGLVSAEVAPNAILNAGGRADPVRCHPGTRKEIISKAETWMESGYLEDRRIFWLSGPAGAGKSAIVQTLAERCIQRKDPMANFFFFRGDMSRAHSRPVVATILYQLFDLFPSLKLTVNNLIRQDRLIFKRSLRDQVFKLLDAPFREMRRTLPTQRPVVLLIDGLDECDSRQDLEATTKSEQFTLLNLLHELVTPFDSAFVALVASRVESHINMAFNTIGSFKDSIYLNEDYHPDNDIRLFITEELKRIKRVHSLGQFLDASWPSDDTIEAIVRKSSGQFIYAATVIRFLANSGQSPAISLDVVLNLRPAKKHSPFAEIDAIYTFILSRCENWDAVREVLVVDHLYRKSFEDTPVISALGYSSDEIMSFFSDLTSIIQVYFKNTDRTFLDVKITFYHASLEDFMYNPGRAAKYHIHLVDCANTLAPRLILGISDYLTLLLAAVVLREVDQRSDPLTNSLTHLPPTNNRVNQRRVWKYLYPKIKALYADDQPLCGQICHALKQWTEGSDDGTMRDQWERPGHPMPFVDPGSDSEPDHEPSLSLSDDLPAEDARLPATTPQAQPKRKRFKWFTRHFR